MLQIIFLFLLFLLVYFVISIIIHFVIPFIKIKKQFYSYMNSNSSKSEYNRNIRIDNYNPKKKIFPKDQGKYIDFKEEK